LGWQGVDYDADIVEEDGGIVGISGEYDAWALSANAICHFKEGPLTPYIGAGIGWSFIDTNIPDGLPSTGCWWDPWWGYVCSTYYPTKDTDAFSCQATLGLRWELDNDSTFFRFGWTSRWLDLGETSGTPRFDIIGAEVGWMFETRRSPPAQAGGELFRASDAVLPPARGFPSSQRQIPPFLLSPPRGALFLGHGGFNVEGLRGLRAPDWRGAEVASSNLGYPFGCSDDRVPGLPCVADLDVPGLLLQSRCRYRCGLPGSAGCSAVVDLRPLAVRRTLGSVTPERHGKVDRVLAEVRLVFQSLSDVDRFIGDDQLLVVGRLVHDESAPGRRTAPAASRACRYRLCESRRHLLVRSTGACSAHAFTE
jgi:hypothetical protein